MVCVIASYLPESMLIKLESDLNLFSDANSPQGFRSAAGFGYFFHEYVHYLHNISTLSGIVVFINTIELWRCFRLTLDNTGFSSGSDLLDTRQREHLRTLISYLSAARRVYVPVFQKGVEPASVEITSLKPVTEIAGPNEPLLSMLVCDAEVSDRDGNKEECRVHIGTLELLESVAWLLERGVFEAIGSQEEISLPPIFPYRVVEAATRYSAPGLTNSATIACVLAALQSSDAPKAFSEVLGIASQALQDGRDPVDQLREEVKEALNQGASKLGGAFRALEEEFANEGVLARAIRQIIDIARRAFQHRLNDPFFELQIITDMRLRPESPSEMQSVTMLLALCSKSAMDPTTRSGATSSSLFWWLTTIMDLTQKMVSESFTVYSILSGDIVGRTDSSPRKMRDKAHARSLLVAS